MRQGRVLLCAMLSGFASGHAWSQEEKPPMQQRIVQSVDAHLPAALELLRQTVEINSGTMNFAGVRAVADVLRPELQSLGFRTRWVEGAPFGRAGHLFAERAAMQPRLRVLLIGHLDTVFEKEGAFQRYEPLPGDQVRGPGITDMKGGNVVMLLMLRALQDAAVLDRMQVTVALMGDEEDSGAPLDLARADLRAAGASADVAIGFEDGDGKFETAVISRRGAEQWTLEVTGKAGHSSLVLRPEAGGGALYEMARILDSFRRDIAPNAAPATFNPALVVGGTTVEHDAVQSHGTAAGKSNVIAGRAVVTGDLRTFTPEQLQQTRQRMRDVVAQSLPHTSAKITFEEGYPPMAVTEGNQRLLSLLDQASRDLGFGAVTAVDPRDAGAADISFIATQVKMAIDGVGLMGTGGHSDKETADITTLSKQAKRLALTLGRMAEAGAPPHPRPDR